MIGSGRRRFSGLRVAHGGTPRPRPPIAAVVGAATAAAAAAAANSADGDGVVAAAGFDSCTIFVLGFTALAGDRARRDTRYNACDARLEHAGNNRTSSTRVWTSMARRRRARCAARLSYGLGALPSRRSHERAAEAARSSVGAGSVRWLSPPQPSRALAGCGVLFSSSLLCLLRSSASGKHAAAAGKPPRATVVDPSPIAATTHAYDSGRFDESTSCHGVRV